MRRTEEQIKLEGILSDVIYTPSDSQRMVKAKFWARRAKLLLTDDALPGFEEVTRLVQDRRMASWWQEPGFKEWFRNEEEFKERTEYVADKALQVLEDILLDQTALPNHRLMAVKMALSLASKFKDELPAEETKSGKGSKNITDMSPTELEAFIKAKSSRLIELKSSDTLEVGTSISEDRDNE